MNKLLKGGLLFSLLFVLLFSCKPDPAEDGLLRWGVKNCTGETIVVDYSPWSRHSPATIDAGDSLYIYFYPYWKNYDTASFHILFEGTIQEEGYNLGVYVDGNKVKVWKLTDRDSSGRQFAKEEYWRHREGGCRYGKRFYEYIDWMFDILPVDLIASERND